jgi:hypothetical protein
MAMDFLTERDMVGRSFGLLDFLAGGVDAVFLRCDRWRLEDNRQSVHLSTIFFTNRTK